METTTLAHHSHLLSRRSAGALGAAFAIALALTGCTSPPENTGPGDGSGAGRFAACLAAAGVPAKAVDPGYVVVRVAGPGQDDASSDTGGHALMTMSDEDGTWVAPADADFFENDPATRGSYAECAKENPEFAQPAASAPGGGVDDGADALADALAFTRCARDAGFAWVADPDAAAGGSIVLPSSLTEAEFRALLAACPPTDYPGGLSWSASDDLSFDWLAVLNEANEAALSGTATAQRVPS